MSNGETLIQANGIELCIETFGSPTNPAILLIHGACASMLWWEAELCQRLSENDRYVIRYDNRDTGKSTTYPPGEPTYSLTDMTLDALAILDTLGIERAHLVGRSMAGAIALIAGVDHPERVASLTFVSTTPGDDDLPPMSEDFLAYTSRNPNPADPAEVTEFIVGLMRTYSGASPYFDEPAMRALATQDVARTKNMASTLTNHFAITYDGPISGSFPNITAPTLIVHGDQDPVFPLPHAQALHHSIPHANLLILPKAGHELPPTPMGPSLSPN